MEGEAVNVLKKLQNPFALVVQGFILGGVVFWSTQSQAARPAPQPTPIVSSLSAN